MRMKLVSKPLRRRPIEEPGRWDPQSGEEWVDVSFTPEERERAAGANRRADEVRMDDMAPRRAAHEPTAFEQWVQTQPPVRAPGGGGLAVQDAAGDWQVGQQGRRDWFGPGQVDAARAAAAEQGVTVRSVLAGAGGGEELASERMLRTGEAPDFVQVRDFDAVPLEHEARSAARRTPGSGSMADFYAGRSESQRAARIGPEMGAAGALRLRLGLGARQRVGEQRVADAQRFGEDVRMREFAERGGGAGGPCGGRTG